MKAPNVPAKKCLFQGSFNWKNENPTPKTHPRGIANLSQPHKAIPNPTERLRASPSTFSDFRIIGIITQSQTFCFGLLEGLFFLVHGSFTVALRITMFFTQKNGGKTVLQHQTGVRYMSDTSTQCTLMVSIQGWNPSNQVTSRCLTWRWVFLALEVPENDPPKRNEKNTFT